MLPETLAEFKASLNSDFPIVYDTKMIASIGAEWKDTVLQVMTLNPEPWDPNTIQP